MMQSQAQAAHASQIAKASHMLGGDSPLRHPLATGSQAELSAGPRWYPPLPTGVEVGEAALSLGCTRLRLDPARASPWSPTEDSGV